VGKSKSIKRNKIGIRNRSFKGTTLYLGIAHTADKGRDINSILLDTTKDTIHMRSVLILQRYFESNTQNGLKYQGKYYQDDSHMSVPFITEYEALHFIFRDGLK
jgi:hypothetical protein